MRLAVAMPLGQWFAARRRRVPPATTYPEGGSGPAPPMSNRTNLILGGVIVGLLLLDLVVLRTGATLFLMKKLTDLVEYLSFWR
jgi:hypothetical protein